MLVIITACLNQLCLVEVHEVYNRDDKPALNVCLTVAPQIVRTFEETNPEWMIKTWECKVDGR